MFMSDQAERKLEEGSKPELSKDYQKEEPNSSSVGILGLLKIILFTLLIFGLIIWLIAIGWIMIPIYLLVAIIVIFPLITNAFKQQGYLLVHVFAITADPFFYYYVVLNKDGISVDFDEGLGIGVTVIRSFLDILKLVYIIYELYQAYNELSKKGGRITIPCVRKKLFFNFIQGNGGDLLANEAVCFWMLRLVDIYALYPIPQMLVISGGKNVNKKMIGFLVQYLIRASRTCFLYQNATGNSGILAEATWAIILFYILLYMQGGHIFGALRYFYAIYTASKGRGGDKGLYKAAIDSGLVKETDIPKKFLSCLSWGLQNLSGFGQNLEPSDNIWENIYSICMTNVGVVMFVFLIGKMQSDATKSIRIKEKWRQITQWSLFKDITDNVKGQIRKDNNSNKWQNKRVKIDNLVTDLPQSTAREVKLQFGLNLLKKVKGFEKLSERSLKDLCECMKPVVFAERTRIIREGDPIDELVFVLEGKIWSYTNASISDSSLINNEGQNLLKGGDLLGEELVAWAAAAHHNETGSSPNPLPVSARTYQAYTNVEAFTILALDLKRVSLLRPFERVVVLLQNRWRFIRYLREKKKRGRRRSLGDWIGMHY